jgi:hypothetical protein
MSKTSQKQLDYIAEWKRRNPELAREYQRTADRNYRRKRRLRLIDALRNLKGWQR